MGFTRPLRRGLPRWPLFSGIRSLKSDDDDTGGQPQRRPSFSAVCVQFVLVARVAVCTLTTVVFHDSRREFLFRLSAGFPLINRPTLLSFN